MKQRERDGTQDANRITSIIATNRVVGGEMHKYRLTFPNLSITCSLQLFRFVDTDPYSVPI